MKTLISSLKFKKALATYLMGALLMLNFPFQAYAALVTVDVQANGLNALTLATSTDSFDISVFSTNAASCQMTAPTASGISPSASMHVNPGDAFYPSIGGSVTFSVTCDDGTGVTASDSVVVSLPAISVPTPPTVNITANGTHGSITLTSPATYTYTWTSTNATSCVLTSPVASGISTAGTSSAEGPGSLFYPSIGAPITITINCTDGTTTVSDSVVINLAAVPGAPTVSITANGAHPSLTLTSPATYTYTWTSTNATSCVLTSPTASGISTAGTSSAVAPGSAFYPSIGAPVTITIECTDGTTTVSDSVVINLSPGGGGGGGGSCTLPTINSSLTASGTVSTAFSYTVTTTSTSTPTYSIGASVLPTGLSFSTTTGVISGTPTQSGTFNISITTTNPCGTDAQTLVLTVAPGGGGGGGPVCGTLPTINSSLTASGTVNSAFSYTITTTSTSTPNLSIGTSTLPVGLSFSTTTGIISGTPTQVETQNIVITATNPCGSNTQTLVITIAAAGGGGGGGGTPPVVSSGGGGGGGGHRHPIVTTTSTGLECFYLRDYMRRDFNNDPIEVMKLQAFLLNFEGYTSVTVNGVFDQATFDAVSAFQMKYEADILTPWGHTAPTGYVYILTLKKVNEIYCQRIFPVTEQQQLEINAHRALLERLNATGGTLPSNEEVGLNATTTPTMPIIGELSPPKGQNISNIATALFAFPTTMQGFMQCLYEWLLILIVLYFLGDVLKDVLYKESEENVLKKFIAKWTIIIVGLIAAIIIAFILYEWCLIFPLLVALILSIIWVSVYPKHDSIKAHTKSWYIVLKARGKSMWIKFKNKNGQVPPIVSAFTADKTLMKVDEKVDNKTN